MLTNTTASWLFNWRMIFLSARHHELLAEAHRWNLHLQPSASCHPRTAVVVDLAALASRSDSKIRKELLDCLRHVGYEEGDLQALLIEKRFESALINADTVGYRYLISHLCGCRAPLNPFDPLKALFYEYGQTLGVVLLILATNADKELPLLIKQLSEADQITLIHIVTQNSHYDLPKLIADKTFPDDQGVTAEDYEDTLGVATAASPSASPGITITAPLPAIGDLPENDYHYRKLPSWSDFRLVLLERQDNRKMIKCHMLPACFNQKFEYEALSYTWGDVHGPQKTILMDGKPFKVTVNLFSALQTLQRPLFGNEIYRFLWVDSLCIDQTNHQERNHQVANMGRIYRQARKVVIWLGEHGEDSDLAMEFIKKVAASSDIDMRRIFLTSSYQYHGEKKYQLLNWKSVDSLFRRDYWRRTWIIQEITLARTVQVLCGDSHFNWTAGNAFYDFLQQDLNNHGDAGPELLAIKQSIMQSPAIQLLESTLVFQKRDMTLKQLLYRHEDSECLERRDKLYGLLALASDCKHDEIKPDYQKPLLVVYKDAVALETYDSKGQTPSPDVVYYSYFLQKILFLSNLNLTSTDMQANESSILIVGCSCGPLTEHPFDNQDDLVALQGNSGVYRMHDKAFLAYKALEDLKALDICDSDVLSNFKWPVKAKSMTLAKSGQTVLVPDSARPGDEICMFSKHDSALVLRQTSHTNWVLVGNALVIVAEERKRRRPRPQLMNFRYCLPDYDIFPPPTSDSKQRFLIRMSTATLYWISRVSYE